MMLTSRVHLCEAFVYHRFQLYEPSRLAPRDLLTLLRKIEREAAACESGIREEREKRRKHRVDDARRVHNYDEFVTTFISMLAEQGCHVFVNDVDNGLKTGKL